MEKGKKKMKDLGVVNADATRMHKALLGIVFR